jgi:quercetin dioxygenase-like cupin family protein
MKLKSIVPVVALTFILSHVVFASAFAQNNSNRGSEPSFLKEAEDSTPAPGRGVLTGTENSVRTQPILFDFEQLEFAPFKLPDGTVVNGVRRKYGVGATMKNTWWEMKKGAVLPVHSHQMEQITHVLKGRVSAYSQGKKFNLVPGKYLFLLPNTPHEFVAEEDSLVEDLQAGDIGNYTGGIR